MARVAHYLFVSSLSVYADNSVAGQDENARVDTLADPASEDIAAHYGPLKAACEQQVLAAFAERATIVRPGLIVGPHDPTDRFSYWVARFLHPRAPGRAGHRCGGAGTAVATRAIHRCARSRRMDARPRGGAGRRHVQRVQSARTLDVRRSRRGAGAASAQRAPPTSRPPGSPTRSSSRTASSPGPSCRCGCRQSDPSTAGFMSFSCGKAMGHGLRFRPLERTLADTADWLAQRDNTHAWRACCRRRRRTRCCSQRSGAYVQLPWPATCDDAASRRCPGESRVHA